MAVHMPYETCYDFFSCACQIFSKDVENICAAVLFLELVTVGASSLRGLQGQRTGVPVAFGCGTSATGSAWKFPTGLHGF